MKMEAVAISFEIVHLDDGLEAFLNYLAEDVLVLLVPDDEAGSNAFENEEKLHAMSMMAGSVQWAWNSIGVEC